MESEKKPTIEEQFQKAFGMSWEEFQSNQTKSTDRLQEALDSLSDKTIKNNIIAKEEASESAQDIDL